MIRPRRLPTLMTEFSTSVPLASEAEGLAYIDREESARDARRIAREPRGRGGFGRGTPQCRSCRRILTGYGASCPGCGGFGWDR